MAINKVVNIQIIASDETSESVKQIADVLKNDLHKSLEQNITDFGKIEEQSTKASQSMIDFENKISKVAVAADRMATGLEGAAKVTILGAIKEGIVSIGEATLVTTGVLAGIAAIDKTFIPLNNILNSTNEHILKTSFAADKAFSEFVKGEGVLKNFQSNLLRVQQKGLELLSRGLLGFRDVLQDTRIMMQGFTNATQASSAVLGGVGKTIVATAKHTEFFEKGLSGLVARASLGASAFAILGRAMVDSESVMTKMAGITLIGLAVAMGGVVIVIHQMIAALGGLVSIMGNKLTQASMEQVEVFSEAEKTTFAFTQTIESYSKNATEAAEATQTWTQFQEKLTQETGTTSSTMRALIAETVSATDSIGLNREQMEQLIERTIDLSERAHRPAIDTLTAMINAMNGAGQGVIALGLHINDAAVEHSKLTKEQKDLYKTSDDATKAQLRFAVLMEQAGKAAGFASDNSDLYSKSIKLQKNAQETLNSELGRGAAIINGQYVYGLATATNLFTEFTKPILPAIGFLQALGGRLMQVGGFLTSNFLTITLLTSSYKALNTLLAKGFAEGLLEKQIPIVNKSFQQLIGSLGATTTQVKDMASLGKAGLEILTKQSVDAAKSLLGLEASAQLTARSVGTQLLKGLQSVASSIMSVTRAGLAFIASPLGLTIAAVAVASYLLFQAFKKLEQETGIFSDMWKELTDAFSITSPIIQSMKDILSDVGTVLSRTVLVSVKATAAALAFLGASAFLAIQGFQELSQAIFGSSVTSDEAIAKTQKRFEALNNAAKKLGSEALSDLTNILIGQAEAVEADMFAMRAFEKSLSDIDAKIAKLSETTKKSMEFAQEFTPKINLDQLKKDATKFETEILHLQGLLQDKKITLLNAPEQTEQIRQMTEQTIAEIDKTEQVIRGIRIRGAVETRDAVLKEVEIESLERRMKLISAQDEINQARLDQERTLRQQIIDIETQSILQQRGLRSVADQEGTTTRQQSLLEANRIELDAFRNKLDTERELAVSMEMQKQREVQGIKTQALMGVGGDVGAAAQADAEVLAEQQKGQQLDLLRQQQIISENEYQSALTQVRLNQQNIRAQQEIAAEQTRVAALGLTPEGLQARLDMQRQTDMMELDALRVKLQNKQLTEAEFRIASIELETQGEMERAQVKQEFLRQDMERDRMRGDSFGATLKDIQLQQQQHGQVMGSIRAIQNSQEFSAAMGILGNLSSLRNSENRKAFEIGKKAAIAQASINTALSATGAYAALVGIPIVGPVLATAAAAAAIAAGVVQIQQIKNQKFGGAGGNLQSGASAAAQAPTPTQGSQAVAGQADKGLDAVPKSLSGKSFILSAGERVVQPEANKDLTEFLAGNQGGDTYNFNFNAPVANRSDAKFIVDNVITELRKRSERGEPIINMKGVVNG